MSYVFSPALRAALRRRRILTPTAFSGGGASFTPASLFESGETGVWFEPSDTTCFRSTSNLTPCADGETCGFMLDLSQGAGYSGGSFTGLGSELLSNGTFDSDITGWTANGFNSSISWSSGDQKLQLQDTAASHAAYATFSATVGKWYLIYGEVEVVSGGGDAIAVQILPGASAALPTGVSSNAVQLSTTGSSSGSVLVLATATTMYVNLSVAKTALTPTVTKWDNISVKELPGNHATQGTLAARPILARVPEGGRRNLLERTEEFDDVYWGYTNSTSTSASRFEDSGSGDNARLFSAPIPEVSVGSAYVGQLEVKADGYAWILLRLANDGQFTGVWFNVSTGAKGTESSGYTGSIVPVGDGYYKCVVEVASWPSGTNRRFGVSLVDGDNVLTSSSTGSGVFIRKAQLEAGSTATDYQKVVDEYDITEAGVTSLDYLSFDGTDDFLGTPITVATGNKSAAIGLLHDANDNLFFGQTSTNRFYLGFMNSSDLNAIGYAAGGGSQNGSTISTGTAYVVSTTDTAKAIVGRLDRVVDISTTYSGTAGGSTLELGRAGGSGVVYGDGRVYSALYIDRALTTAELGALESYMAGKSGVTL